MQALRDKLERDSFDLTAQSADDGFARANFVNNRALSALAGDPLANRFRHWRGASGRRYIFSVYDLASCPAYDDVVLIVAAVARNNRRIVFIADTGALPELTIERAKQMAAALNCPVEFHVHLLASSRAERAAVISDFSSTPDQSEAF
jgi:hypothetical protein